MKRVYIIGSLTREVAIKELAMFIQLNTNFDVHYVKKDPRQRHLSELISDCFDEIEKADVIIAMEKTSHVFGNGTLYEMEYAKRCKRPIFYTDGANKSELLMDLYRVE